MTMKKQVVLFAIVVLQSVAAAAQQEPDKAIQAVFDACWSMRTAIGAGNTTSLRSANEDFRACKTSDFASLKSLDKEVPSLNGHFVWDEDFVDSLVAGRSAVRKFAQRYANERTVRTTGKGGILTKTCMVKGGGSAFFSFRSRGHQELGVITEPGGKISLRIYDRSTNTWYNDTEDVKRGRESRMQVFDLSGNKITVLTMEVVNCGKEDISFVVISN